MGRPKKIITSNTSLKSRREWREDLMKVEAQISFLEKLKKDLDFQYDHLTITREYILIQIEKDEQKSNLNR